MIAAERKTALLNAMQKLEAYRQIQNEMGRAVAAFNFRQADRLLSFFALDKADVSLEYADEGVFNGPEAVRAIVNDVVGKEPKPGEMLDMQLTTPIIEIADDLQTAKCVWWMPGAGAIPQEEGDPMAIWAWGELAVTFVQEGDAWKIWKLHYFRYMKCDYKKGWVDDTSMINRLNTPLHPMSDTTTYHNPYSPTNIRVGIPCPPKPYAVYDAEKDKNWELDVNKNW